MCVCVCLRDPLVDRERKRERERECVCAIFLQIERK